MKLLQGAAPIIESVVPFPQLHARVKEFKVCQSGIHITGSGDVATTMWAMEQRRSLKGWEDLLGSPVSCL